MWKKHTEIISELFQNNFIYLTYNHVWNWNKSISAGERLVELFQKYFSDTEHVGKYLSAAIIDICLK